ncbi:hypothetical protein [Microvirga arabica]|uniref:hypothetical protein n=1 Tax=Microvirga arabica TaxID=1128671 RepID=UPI00366E3B64
MVVVAAVVVAVVAVVAAVVVVAVAAAKEAQVEMAEVEVTAAVTAEFVPAHALSRVRCSDKGHKGSDRAYQGRVEMVLRYTTVLAVLR